MAHSKEEKVERELELLHRREEEESMQLLSQKYRIPYLNLATFPIDIDAFKVVPEDRARAAGLVVFQMTGKRLKIGVRNPEKEAVRAILGSLERDTYTYELFLVSSHSLEYAWSFYKKISEASPAPHETIQVSPEKLSALRETMRNLDEIRAKIEETFVGRTTETLEIILAGALSLDASDIHIEPKENTARLRFRLDGVLYDITELPKKLFPLLLSRIKLISDLKLNIHDRAQDGRFTIRTDSIEIEVRTSTLPGPHGENVVLRVLNPATIQIPFEKLGMHDVLIKTIGKELKKPNGMILVTGPTGSGKTTTLYAFLQKIHTPKMKIITIEDPIEYHLKGVEQTQVDPEHGYDFVNGLRAIVRQDPDVILVGEIRDLETAETAMHAALTGHLVFSTLHTNNAAGTIPRLIDLGVKPAIIAPAINITLAQRLVRKLCATCRKKVSLGVAEKKRMQKELSRFPKKFPIPAQWTIFETTGGGCRACNHLGYKGQIGIFESILVDEAVERLILASPSEFEITKEALRQGQLTMRQDGLLKVLAGITDLNELERVIGASPY